MNALGPLIALVFYALILYALYWIIRLAVRHAIRDADQRRGAAARPAPGRGGPAADTPAAD